MRSLITRTVTVPQATLEELLSESGLEHREETFSSKRFPVTGDDVGTWGVCYFFWPAEMVPSKVYGLIKEEDPENPWQPARLAHQLRHHSLFPDDTKDFFGTAVLGSHFEYGSCHACPVFVRWNEGGLDLGFFDTPFDTATCFLAVRRIK